MDKGFKLYLLILLWLGIACGVPKLIWGETIVGLCAIISGSIALVPVILSDGIKKSRAPITIYHCCLFLAYSVVGMWMIGFKKLAYEEMKTLGESMIFYIILPVIVFFVEVIIKGHTNNKVESE